MVLRFTVVLSVITLFHGCCVLADVRSTESTQHSGVITGRGALPTALPGLTLAITRQPSGQLFQPHSAPAYHHDDDLQSRLRRRRRESDTSVTSSTESDVTAQPQHLFPSFQPLYPLGHSRPQPLFQQEPAYSQREPLLRPQYNAFHPLDFTVSGGGGGGGVVGGAFRDRVYPSASLTSANGGASSGDLLGSGNFGVIHGGTFYTGEKDEIVDGDSDEEDIDPDFGPTSHIYGANGHGRPSSGGYYRGNPEPQRYRTHDDFFSNFRDFAEISTPTKSSFSELYVVYVNRNATKDDVGAAVAHGDVVSASASAPPDKLTGPRNIMERLALLDKEALASSTESVTTTSTPVPPKKMSLGKRKLALLLKKKFVRKTGTSTTSAPSVQEPLIALS